MKFSKHLMKKKKKKISGHDVYAVIDEPDFENVGTKWEGWCAEVFENEVGETVFSTLGFESREELVSSLKAAGINDIQTR